MKEQGRVRNHLLLFVIACSSRFKNPANVKSTNKKISVITVSDEVHIRKTYSIERAIMSQTESQQDSLVFAYATSTAEMKSSKRKIGENEQPPNKRFRANVSPIDSLQEQHLSTLKSTSIVTEPVIQEQQPSAPIPKNQFAVVLDDFFQLIPPDVRSHLSLLNAETKDKQNGVFVVSLFGKPPRCPKCGPTGPAGTANYHNNVAFKLHISADCQTGWLFCSKAQARVLLPVQDVNANLKSAKDRLEEDRIAFNATDLELLQPEITTQTEFLTLTPEQRCSYMNQQLAFITGTCEYVTKHVNDKGEIEYLVMSQQKIESKYSKFQVPKPNSVCTESAFTWWNQGRGYGRLEFKNRRLIPKREYGNPFVLNTFRPPRFDHESLAWEECLERTQHWRELGLSDMCSGDQELFDKVINLLYFLVLEPDKRPLWMLLVQGKSGSGKNSFFERPLTKLLGKHAIVVGSAKVVSSGFNAHLDEKVLTIYDEMHKIPYNQMGELHRQINGLDFLKNAKGVDAKSQEATSNFIGLTEEVGAFISMSPEQQRFGCIVTGDRWCGPNTSAKLQFFDKVNATPSAAIMGFLVQWHKRRANSDQEPIDHKICFGNSNQQKVHSLYCEAHSVAAFWHDKLNGDSIEWFQDTTHTWRGPGEWVEKSTIYKTYNQWCRGRTPPLQSVNDGEFGKICKRIFGNFKERSATKPRQQQLPDVQFLRHKLALHTKISPKDLFGEDIDSDAISQHS
jgi:hypothetical protein